MAWGGWLPWRPHLPTGHAAATWPFPFLSHTLEGFLPHVVATSKNCPDDKRSFLWVPGHEVCPGATPHRGKGRGWRVNPEASSRELRFGCCLRTCTGPISAAVKTSFGVRWDRWRTVWSVEMLVVFFSFFSSFFFHSISALNLAPYRGDKLTLVAALAGGICLLWGR